MFERQVFYDMKSRDCAEASVGNGMQMIDKVRLYNLEPARPTLGYKNSIHIHSAGVKVFFFQQLEPFSPATSNIEDCCAFTACIVVAYNWEIGPQSLLHILSISAK